ncbi:MAG: LPXTG cell wall anchor domain-containing protein [Methanosarcina mazei]|uniref:helix-turn-helix transcriptional regulator n=1 Tax=Methanosarcina TaxID=2207 RepID=UPI00064F1DA3|nr:LPXTG cell wall anchor domain-containing protein [Methanosarcina soligelidi]
MNFRKLCKIACVFIFLLFVQGNAVAATIHGSVYEWYTFKPLENSIVEINSTPEQYLVATDAEYSFNLTQGTYLITASYLEDNTIVYQTEEEVIITSDDGDYVHDLLLFPTYQQDLLYQEDFENVDLDLEEETQPETNSQNTILIFAAVALCILLLAGYFIKKGKKNPPGKAAYPPEETRSLTGSEPAASELISSNPASSESISSKPSSSELIPSHSASSESNSPESENLKAESQMPEYAEPGEGISLEKVSGTNYELSGSHIGDVSEIVIPAQETEIPVQETELSVQQREKLPADSKTSISSLSEEKPDLLSPEVPKSREAGLPDDLKEIMDLIRASGNRITQRELRKKSPYSESKVSLMLSDLEERGLIEKFKKGRGNIIRIPDSEILKQGEFLEKKE